MATYMAQEMVHESDERYEQIPTFKDVAFLLVQTQAGTHRGTGFLVEAEGHCIVLTAAHCLYDDKARGVAKRVEIFFGRESREEVASFKRELQHMYVPHTYRPTAEKDFEQDYGFIYLGKKEYFLKHKGFDLVHLNEDKLTQPGTIFITGYPADGPKQHHQYSVRLTNIKCHQQRRFLTYNDATFAGMSGAPLYFTSPVGHFAVGIHVNAENGAVWLTDDEISSIKKAVLRVAGGSTVGWQHHQLTEQMQTTHLDGDTANKNRQISDVREPGHQLRSQPPGSGDTSDVKHPNPQPYGTGKTSDVKHPKPQSSGTGKTSDVRASDKNTSTSSSLRDKQSRLQQDLECPVYIIGNMHSADSQLLACIHLKYDLDRVNLRKVHIDNNGVLVDIAGKGPKGNTSGRFQKYWDTTSTVPLPQTGHPQYMEVVVGVGIDKPLREKNLVLELGVCREEEMDVMHQTPDHQYCYSLGVAHCPHHNSVCTNVGKDGKVVHHVSDTLPNTVGSHTLHYGMVYDSNRKAIVFIDVKGMKIIKVLDNVNCDKPVWPMFGVYAHASMKLVVGNDINMTPEKKILMLKAL